MGRRTKTYFHRTCKKVAKELNINKREVEIIMNGFFKALHKAIKEYKWVHVYGFFKLKIKKHKWRQLAGKGIINPRENYTFSNYIPKDEWLQKQKENLKINQN